MRITGYHRNSSILTPLRGLAAVGLACLVLLTGGCGDKSENQANGMLTITVWHPWGGAQKERLASVVKEFNRVHKDFQVRALFSPTDLDTSQKFYTAVAANKPPDAVFVDGTQTAAWAEQGALQPLDRFVTS